MPNGISIVSLIINASWVVQFVILILVLFSVISWGIIFDRYFALRRMKKANDEFLEHYKKINNIGNLFNALNDSKKPKHCSSLLFINGITEYNSARSNNVEDNLIILQNIERSLSASIEHEIENMESSLSTLATFGSVSPYIGLFGTVWGIMHAFIGLGATGQATLNSVAPGIAEALVATAIGLFVSIPAYIAYNKFSSNINVLINKMNRFADEFLNLINKKIQGNN